MTLCTALPAWAQAEEPVAPRWDRLRIVDTPAGSFRVLDGYGRPVNVERFSRAMGDFTTLRAVQRSSSRQRAVGTTLLVVGPAVMLVGVERVSQGGFRGVSLMQAAGYGSLGLGLAGTLGGVALLRDPRAREPDAWYSREQVEALIQSYELYIQGTWSPNGAEVRLTLVSGGSRSSW